MYSGGMDRGYGRISLDTARSGSITKQRERITGYAGHEIEWYADESVSGSKIPFGDRPDGARLLHDLRAGDRVLVTRIDRAARSVRDLLDLVEVIEKRGASIVFVDQNIDTAGPMGRFLLTLLGAIAELEAAIIGERRRESLESFAKEGRHAVGKAPWGFVSLENPGGRGLVIRPDPELVGEAREIVRRIVAGETQESVRQAAGFSKTGMHKWLHNPRLAGMTPDGDGVVTVDGVPRVDPEAALLTLAEWRELQESLEHPEKTWAQREGFGRALMCGVCGQRMYWNVSKAKNTVTGATHDTYTCRRVKHEPGQGAPSIMVHRADAYMEQRFLSDHGHRRALLPAWIDSKTAKDEATALAEVHLQEAQRRFSLAVSDEQEDEALTHLRDAKRALRDAQSLRGERVFTAEDTGKTVAEIWAGADIETRTQMLRQVATWRLMPGRGSVEQRIVVEVNEMMLELVTLRPGAEGETHVDEGTFLLSQPG